MRIINTADILPNTPLDRHASDWVYNGLDCCVTQELIEKLLPQLDDTARATYDFSLALQAPILEMTCRGVLVDQYKRAEVLDHYDKQIAQLEQQLFLIVTEGIGFKVDKLSWWRSNVQLKRLFYEVLGLPVQYKRGAGGERSPTLDRDTLEKFDDYFFAQPLCLHILALRDIEKKRGFLKTGIDPDGRIRTTFNIAGTNTGRLASSMSAFGTGTNLQNVDRELRSVFIADPGYKFANVDLEQGDARNVGAICWQLFVEPCGEAYAGKYLDACESGDLHTTNCRLIWPHMPWTGDMKQDKEIAEQIFYRQDSFRQMSKKGGHGTNYYGTDRTMAKHLKVPTALIRDFQIAYFNAYPVIGCLPDPFTKVRDFTLPNWHNWVRREIADTHTITTMLGRRRQFFGRSDDDSTLREAIAFEPQSLTADEIDTGLIRVWRGQKVQCLIQVHDSLLVQYKEEDEAEVLPWLLNIMRVVIQLKKGRDFVVPVEAKVGWNWGEQVTEADVAKAIAKGKPPPRLNLDGLIKWKGGDDRKRQSIPGNRFATLFR